MCVLDGHRVCDDEMSEWQTTEQLARRPNQQRVSNDDRDGLSGTGLPQCANRRLDGSTRTQHVVNDHWCPVPHVSNHAVSFDFVSAEPSFVNERHRSLQQATVFTGELDGAKIGCDNDRGIAEAALRSVGEERHGGQMIDRRLEKSFDGWAVGIDEHQTGEPGGGHDIGRDARTE